MKYIDADRLRAEIEERKEVEGWCEVGKDTADVYYARGFRFACDFALTGIDSLQQEQPEADLDEEIDNYFYPKNFKRVNDGVEFPGWHVSDWKNPNVGKKLFTDDLRRFARHFYELGLNARKEE